MSTRSARSRFAICLDNEGCEDLEVRRLYPVLPDESAARDGYVRVIDESGEDYLYPAARFAFVHLPREVEDALAAVTPAS